MPLVLTSFKHVRKFAWKGIRLGPELESLKAFLEMNCDILDSLNLDFTDWQEVEDAWDCHHWLTMRDQSTYMESEYFTAAEKQYLFAQRLLPLSSKGLNRVFASLTVLSLCAAPLSITAEELSVVFNINQLNSLALHRCEGATTFLHAIAQAHVPLVLRHLELVVEDEINWGTEESAIAAFLQSFQGLEHLYLMIKPVLPAERYWLSINRHLRTLKRLTYP